MHLKQDETIKVFKNNIC